MSISEVSYITCSPSRDPRHHTLLFSLSFPSDLHSTSHLLGAQVGCWGLCIRHLCWVWFRFYVSSWDFFCSENYSILALKYLLALILWHLKNYVETKFNSLLQFGTTARSTVLFDLSESSGTGAEQKDSSSWKSALFIHWNIWVRREMFLKGWKAPLLQMCLWRCSVVCSLSSRVSVCSPAKQDGSRSQGLMGTT